LNKGTTSKELGSTLSAIECFDKAVEIDPKSALIWYNKSVVLGNLGKQNEADECLFKAKELGFKQTRGPS